MKPHDDFSTLAKEHTEFIRKPLAPGGISNILQHMWGYQITRLCQKEKSTRGLLKNCMEKYSNALRQQNNLTYLLQQHSAS